ncbi:MAG TPA: hypothetical protein VFG50_16995 [Rhodothermales bacterium]|nr:hypothetical protein [Rhodothermales bacterium]
MAYEFFLGIDRAGDSDLFTLALVEKSRYATEGDITYHVRRLEQRCDQDASAVAAFVKDLIADEPYVGRTEIVVNRTQKQGRALLQRLVDEGLTPIGATLTGGDSAAQSGPGIVVDHGIGPNNEGGFIISEHDVVEAVEEIYRNGQLKLEHDSEEMSSMAHGLEDYVYRAGEAGVALEHISGRPGRRADHHDLVLATALACWYGQHLSFDPSEHYDELPDTGAVKRMHRPDVTH